MSRRISKLGLTRVRHRPPLAVVVFAYSGSFLLAMSFSAGSAVFALMVLLLLAGMRVEKRGWERQEDERIARHREARHADPVHAPRGDFRRKRKLRPMRPVDGHHLRAARRWPRLPAVARGVAHRGRGRAVVVGILIVYAVTVGPAGDP